MEILIVAFLEPLVLLYKKTLGPTGASCSLIKEFFLLDNIPDGNYIQDPIPGLREVFWDAQPPLPSQSIQSDSNERGVWCILMNYYYYFFLIFLLRPIIDSAKIPCLQFGPRLTITFTRILLHCGLLTIIKVCVQLVLNFYSIFLLGENGLKQTLNTIIFTVF